MTSLLTKIKSLDTQISTNTENISNKQDALTAGNNITIDENNIISSSGGGSITQENLDLKQDKLTAGTNITIDINNNISSSGGITQSQLDTKQNTLTLTTNINTGTISLGNITGRTGSTITAPTISSSGNLFYGNNINVGSKIATIESNLNLKQATLTSTSNISTGTISSGSITGRTSSIITAPTITAASNLLYGSTNVATKIGELETNKQNKLIAGTNITIDTNNNISSSGGVTQSQLDAKQATLILTSNIITGTIDSGNITGRTNSTITAPTITASSNLLYGNNINVSTKIGELETNKQNILTTETDLTLRNFICNSITSEGVNLNTSLNSKQNTLIAGDNITITKNTISSSGGGSDITQEDLDLKQDKLDATSILSVNRLSSLGDITSGGDLMYYDIFFGSRNVRNVFSATNSAIDRKQDMINFLTNLTCATLDCSNLNIGGESIDTKIANSGGGGGITQAQLDTKQNTLTSSTNILTKRIDVSDKVVITGAGPALYLKDTDHRSGMVYMNSNIMYFLSGAANSETWTQVGGQWPLQLNTSNNSAQFGGTITTPSYTFSSGKPRFRITRSNFTLLSGTTSLLNGGTVDFESNVTLSNGIFIASIPGVYCVTCKLRLPDSNTQSPEIQWYVRDKAGNQFAHESLEMWIPAGIRGRRAGMSSCLVNLLGGGAVNTMAGCYATFEGFLVQ